MYSDQDIANLVARVQQLEMQVASRQVQGISTTKMVSPNFLTRAFAVWGHNFVASMLIGLGVSCIFTIISLIIGNAVFAWWGDLIQSFGF